MTSLRAKLLCYIAIPIFTAYIVVCFLVFLFQRSVLYFPTHRSDATRLSPWVSDGQTIGYYRQVPNPDAVWLMMHGNAGQASDRDYVLEHLSDKDAFYVLEYPGYGAREGSPSKSSIDAAAQEAYCALRAQYPGIPIGVIGESIGSGAASMLAKADPMPDKIVLITPFDTLHRVAAKKFNFLPVGLLLLDRWDNIESLANYRDEIEIYAAQDDAVIPMRHARALNESCSNAIFREIPGGHNDWSFCNDVVIRMQR